MAFSWASAFRITLLLLLLAAVIAACFTLPIEKVSFFIRFCFRVFSVFYVELLILRVGDCVDFYMNTALNWIFVSWFADDEGLLDMG